MPMTASRSPTGSVGMPPRLSAPDRSELPSGVPDERDPTEVGAQVWYALFLSAFLLGLLLLGGFWIWLNVRFL